MSRVITFSRTYPSYHPKAGQPTYFIEKFLSSILDADHIAQHYRNLEILKSIGGYDITTLDLRPIECFKPKHHTIRAGHRWKAGDWFSPRVWSGKPYNSKQVQFAPDIQVKKTWDIEVDGDGCIWIVSDTDNEDPIILEALAKNVGLTLDDLQAWFSKPLVGQIICWNESINY